jgi:hypothetical protein
LGWILSEVNAKAQSRQDATGFFLLRNQETKNHRKDFMVFWLLYGIVFGRAFASLRLCVKSLLHGGRLQRPTMGQKASGHARPGRGQIGQPGRNWGGRSHDWNGATTQKPPFRLEWFIQFFSSRLPRQLP